MAVEEVNGSSPIKARSRRNRAEMDDIRAAIFELLAEDNPQTVRQVFYALTVRGVVQKTEMEYKHTVCRLLCEMREDGTIPFSWLADNTRWMRKPTTFSGLQSCLDATAHLYRRNLWNDSDHYVEVWCEKDALAGVIMEETEVYDVPLMVARGYASLSFLHGAAKAIEAKGKPATIFHVGDLDPSGLDAARDIEEKLRRYAPDADIDFERIAVTPQQVERWNLPTRPTKTKDTRAAKFSENHAASVELDAIPARELRALIREHIEILVDPDQLRVLQVAEESEKQQLAVFAKEPRHVGQTADPGLAA
jgi:hypothetical protein